MGERNTKFTTDQTHPYELPLVVGVGASAGGLDAFLDFLKGIGDASEIAIIFVQHLDPSSKTLLVDLVSASTSLNVFAVSSRKKLKGGTVYICPPQTLLEVKNGWVRAVSARDDERENNQRPTNLIDRFFHSIADEQGDHGIGIVLSGAGSDGTLGLKAISDRGGLTFAQDPMSARYDAMPRSAAITGVADHVMSPADIATELLRFQQHLREVERTASAENLLKQIEEAIPTIAAVLEKVTDHNFQHYKKKTLVRRIQRRQNVLKIRSVSDYVDHLQNHDEEAQALFRELLIGVTAFFRDPDVFEKLSERVIEKLIEERTADDGVRIWVAGCANGAEAYSIAILCAEAMDKIAQKRGRRSPSSTRPESQSAHSAPDLDLPDIQIFATDIDERALQIARVGDFPIGIAENVSAERLKRFFIKRGNRYQVTKQIRDMVLFSAHNLISDPPFTRQDLISCRNLLIYLGPHLQQKLIPLFHYALRPAGYLLLGPSESITTHGELFKTLDAKHRISQRQSTAVGPATGTTTNLRKEREQPDSQTSPEAEVDLTLVMQKIALDEFTPKTAVIDHSGQLLTSSPNIEKYLSLAGGTFQNNIIKMAARGLQIGLRTAISDAKRTCRKIEHENLSVRVGDKVQKVMVTVQPMPELGEHKPLFLVVFQDVGLPIGLEQNDAPNHVDSIDADSIIAHLEHELETTRDDLERTLQDMDVSNEELKSANEELVSTNEELQSANEELETSKDEIQTALAHLAQSDSDRRNLLNSSRIATLFVDNQMVIRSFSPHLTEIYNLIPTDVGRPLGHTTHTAVDMPPYPSDLSQVEAWPIENEVETQSGDWYLRRIQPYVNDQNQDDGLVVTFYKISDHKRATMRLAAANAVAGLLIDADSFDEVIGDVLKGIRESLEAEVCLLWLPDGESSELYCKEADAEDYIHQPFVEVSREKTFAIGKGLPGLVWQQREPVWFSEIQSKDQFARSEVAARCRLTSGVATPIIVGHKFKGVIEIFTTRYLQHEPELLDLLKSLGNEIGQFIRRRRLEEEFRDQEARKSAILRSALDSIITMDVAGRIVEFNPAAEQTFGYSAADVIGRPLGEVIIPDEFREAHAKGIQRYLASGDSRIVGKRIELTGQRRDGSQFPVELAISVSQSRDGSPFFTGYLRDISERWRAQTILQQRAKLAELHATLAVSLAGTEPLDEILRKCCEHLVAVLEAMAARVWLMDERQQSLRLAAFADRGSPFYRDQDSVPIGDSTVGKIARKRQAVLSNDLANDPNMDEPQWCERADIIAFAGYPLIVEDRVVGVLELYAGHELIPEVISQLQPVADAMAQCVARKAAEQAVLERESHLRRVIDNMLGFVGELDLDGTLVEVNDTALTSGGVRRDDVIGEKFWDCYWWNFDPQTIKQLQDAVRRAGTGELVRYDTLVRMAGDTRMMIDFMLVPARDRDGKIIHLIPSGVDITDRKRAERMLADAKERLELSMEVSQVAPWSWNMQVNDIVADENLKGLFGFGKDEEVHIADFIERIDDADRSRVSAAVDDATQNGAFFDEEYQVNIPPNSVRWMRGRGRVRQSNDGKVEDFFGVVSDITDRKLSEIALRKSEQRANEANVAKSEFLANMSHEIRTPMTAILGYADLLNEQIEHEEAKKYLQTIRRNGDFLLDIINDILDLSKIEAGKLEIIPERFALDQFVEDVRSIMEVRATENGLKLEVEYKDQIPAEIESDPKRLKQILINLVGNAIKFTREGTVRIVVQFKHDRRPRLVFTVVDTGIGISTEQQERLFKPFSQGDSSVSREFGGTGLGLAISHRLVNLLGGDIDVESSEGRGSKFTFAVSVGDISKTRMIQPEPLLEAVQGDESAEDIALDCHVLIVDDSRDIRFLSRHLLTSAGATVHEAEDGQIAIDHFRNSLKNGLPLPDLVLLDMQMPNLDGYETAKHLRNLDYTGPIIALTADAMQGDMNRSLECGCNDYLSKPIDAAKLTRMVYDLTR